MNFFLKKYLHFSTHWENLISTDGPLFEQYIYIYDVTSSITTQVLEKNAEHFTAVRTHILTKL